ncbi:MAG: hypothetical protein ACREHD_26415, partial [Pirellulales bacterium]
GRPQGAGGQGPPPGYGQGGAGGPQGAGGQGPPPGYGQGGANGPPQGGANGPPNGQNPGGANGPQGQNGMGPNGPNGPGNPGAPGGNNQGPFAGAKGEGAEAVAQQFYEKLMAGEANGASELYSSKASAKIRAFRDGKASESMIEEFKNAFAKVKFNSTKSIRGEYVVLLTESGSGTQGSRPGGYGGGPGGYGGGQAQRSNKKASAGATVQFQIVSEYGKFVIKDIRVH